MWLRYFSSAFSISKTKTMNLEKCYFRFLSKEEKVNITFLFKVKEAARQFNLSRNPTETLENLFTRIGTNVQKSISKANKKKGNICPVIEVSIYDENTGPVEKSSTCQDLFIIENPLKVKIYDQVYEAVFNAPWVEHISLPQSILAGFPVYPHQYVSQYADEHKTVFRWYRGSPLNDKGCEVSEIHIKWELAGTGYLYTPQSQDVGMKLKLECIPGNEKLIGPSVETISKCLVEANPGKCPFETRHMFTTSKLCGKSFRCVSYNILADLYCDSEFTRTVLHPYCPPYALHIDYRKQLILKEILGYNADILCLQEVDSKIFDHYLKPILSLNGLEGVFHKKGKEVSEGLACFYRKDRFGLLDKKRIVLSEALKTEECLQSIWESIKDNGPLTGRLLDRSTICSAIVLQSKDNENEVLIVGDTHLYFHPDADHIRLLQGGIAIYWLRNLHQITSKKYPNKNISLILCGDFNSVPSCGIYQLYTTGVAPNTLPDWSSNANEAVKNVSLEQDIILASACGTPQYTNFTSGFADCLDYIYYEIKNLEVEQVVPLPSIEELTAHTALPSIVFPSDHVSLVADLRFK